MNSKLVLLIVLSLSVSLVGNSYAHKSQVIGDYKIEVGWKYEPPTAGKRNYIELIVTEASDEDKASGMSSESDKEDTDHSGMDHDATKSEEDKHGEKDEHDYQDGISGLAKKLEVDVTLNSKKAHLKLHENVKRPGHYLAIFTPSDEGFPSVHIFGKIVKSDIEATFHPEKVEAKTKT